MCLSLLHFVTLHTEPTPVVLGGGACESFVYQVVRLVVPCLGLFFKAEQGFLL